MSRPPKNRNTSGLIADGIRRGNSLKRISYDLGLSLSWTYRIAQELGYCATMISREEQKLIAEFRQTKTKTK